MIFKVSENELTGKFFKEERYEMRSEDGQNQLQCSLVYRHGKTKKGEFARAQFEEEILQEDFPYYMLENTEPQGLYSLLLDVPQNQQFKEQLKEQAEMLGFQMDPKSKGKKREVMVKKFQL